MRNVFLACPTHGQVDPEMMVAASDAVRRGRVMLRAQAMSLLAMNFNTLWCEALNARQEKGLTHFAMIHGDVAPEGDWLNQLIDEQERVGADILSCVVPIKDGRNLTSTALLDRDGNVERIGTAQLAGLPPTFDASAFTDKVLLINTGLFVVDFTKPWVENVWFEIRDSIRRDESGQFIAETFPEDWNFSVMLAKLGGIKVFATQTIGLKHFGRTGYTLPGVS